MATDVVVPELVTEFVRVEAGDVGVDDVFEVGFELGWVKSWQLQGSVKEDSTSFLDNSSSVGLGSHNQLVLFRDREGVTLLSEPVVTKALRRPFAAASFGSSFVATSLGLRFHLFGFSGFRTGSSGGTLFVRLLAGFKSRPAVRFRLRIRAKNPGSLVAGL